MIPYMSYAKQLFLAAVAACALIAFVTPARAQETTTVIQKHLK
jgi:hypothetical protein